MAHDWQQYFDRDYRGNMVEVGANDGLFQSEGIELEAMGWEVLCIEPNPCHEASLREYRKHVEMVAAWHEDGEADLQVNGSRNNAGYTSIGYHLTKGEGSKIKVPTITLNTLLPKHFENIDILHIDVEGDEDKVLQGIDLNYWTPKVLSFEWNPSSFEISKMLAENHGYTIHGLLPRFNGGDAIYLREEADAE